ncbi:MAG: hypothetical protein KKA73_23250 [Chloroflexi bacterium]|nr:hypothetical protein [Chloroflexota bacterium]MBU1750608.1 hypothetical protein [Chloroflexota bacterium]MBU1879728.1 hypothetical protein [Chloroflexota bacterium]
MSLLDRIHGAAIRTGFALWYGWQPYGRHTAFLERSQWWPWPQLEEYQTAKLRALLTQAYANIPFYRQRFDEVGLCPAAVHAPADLIGLPVLTKAEIQDHGENLLARNVDRRRLHQDHTGGSTGHPLAFYQDAGYTAWCNADKLRCYRLAGYRLGQRWAFLWGSDYDAQAHKGHRGQLADRLVYNTLWIDTFDLDVEMLAAAARQLARWRPRILVAYVSSAVLLARLVQERGIVNVLPHAIQTSAEVLTPDDRRLLEEAFGCPIFDRYGCREVGNIAHECSAHQGLHVLAENNLLELLDEADQPVPPGQPGRVVVTNLNNHAMPLIRYETGDMAVASAQPCTCGRGLPLLESVVGRVSDLITSPSGRLLHGEFFTHLFYKTRGVRQFRVIQETRHDLLIELVPGPGFDQATTCNLVEQGIQQHGDPAFRVRFELHEHLAPSASGKYQFTISRVPHL